MAEFTGGNEKYISAGEPIVFENKTESKYAVCAGIVFNKSGIYEVSIVGNRTIISEVPRRTGKWIPVKNGRGGFECSECHEYAPSYQDGVEWLSKFCPRCGAVMTEGVEQDE